ncbi:MAG TPA: N-acetyl-gamma-glutamyl-phosphate reductase [Armatimonadota bacterium]|jgi:N-acetyl-gamma-glutamyl-phosphate reductase
MLKVAVFGAAGYGGVELIRLFLDHPEVQVTYLGGHSNVDEQLTDLYPHLLGDVDAKIGPSEVPAALEHAELLFSALPHAVGAPLVAEALRAGAKVIDFSADFRLHDVATYERYYTQHPVPELLAEAVYGLPELHREQIRTTRLLAVPGCYPTGATLALAPAVRAGLIEPQGIIVDSKSGVSGAGRTSKALTSMFCETTESVTAYNVGVHRHQPEMDQELGSFGAPVRVTFSPHLMPMARGILTTAYGRLLPGVTQEQIEDAYREFYREEPFVTVLPWGKQPATKQVTGSNRCHVGLTTHEEAGLLIATSVIDNLIKGLSGAAVQCLNLMQGWPETTALQRPAMWP